MERKYLVLLTNNYPFGLGEEFIQVESKYLSQKFEKVFIITFNINPIFYKVFWRSLCQKLEIR